jgi:RNA polymerase sigma factor (sigma-70 family)
MSQPDRRPDNVFRTTQWTQVLEARGNSPEAKSALCDLCAAYYSPVFAFIRREGRDDETARDLTQEFFARLLARPSLDNAAPERGRFRSFVLGSVKHFLADMRDHANAAKRGSGEIPVSIQEPTDTSPGVEIPDPQAPSPDREFDRKWALTVLDRSLATLAAEHATASEAAKFEALKPWLTGDTDNLSQADAAAGLAINEGAVKVAIHRLRRRFRETIKAEISRTVSDRSQVDQELRHLVEAMG